MAGSGGVQAIKGVGGGGNGRVEAEGEGGCPQIVVDRLGNAHHRDSIFKELLGNGERAVAADADQPTEIELPHGRGHLIEDRRIDGNPLILANRGRKAALVGGAENRTALREDTRGVAAVELQVAHRLNQALITPQKADTVVVEPDGRFHHRSDDSVETWTVAANGEDADTRLGFGHKSLREDQEKWAERSGPPVPERGQHTVFQAAWRSATPLKPCPCRRG